MFFKSYIKQPVPCTFYEPESNLNSFLAFRQVISDSLFLKSNKKLFCLDPQKMSQEINSVVSEYLLIHAI